MLSPVTQEARVQFPASAIIQTNFFFLLLLQFWPLKMILTTRVYQLESNPLGCTFISGFLINSKSVIRRKKRDIRIIIENLVGDKPV